MSAHENLEHAEHAEHASHGGNKKIALLISVLALFLASRRRWARARRPPPSRYNVASNDLWAFFQAKNIRVHDLAHRGRAVAIAADRAARRHEGAD